MIALIYGNYDGFKQFVKDNKNSKVMTLYWDIETLQYNRKLGRTQASLYKNVTYSLCIGFYQNNAIQYILFPSFREFYETFFDICTSRGGRVSCRAVVEMIAHNCNKYDNHFMLHDICMHYNAQRENMYLKNALDDIDTTKMKEAKQRGKKENLILEKRVKSSNNLELQYWLKGVHFRTVDNYMKTHTSIAVLGKKLKDLNILTDDELKTDFDYEIFDRDDDMTEVTAHEYAYHCYKTLNTAQLQYIRNDVLILGYSHLYYGEIFPSFDYSKVTFSMNVLDSYLNSPLTQFQLLNKVGQKNHLEYSKYKFDNDNLYDYVKSFYRGGLNMYNARYVGVNVTAPCFSIDINSSYPYVMYHEPIPTFVKDYASYTDTQYVIPILNDDFHYALYRMTKFDFNEILGHIDSTVLKQTLVKYYSGHDYVNINTYTLKMIENLTNIKIKRLKVKSYISYECRYFGARDIIHDNYEIKTQGKLTKKIEMRSPYDYTITDEDNPYPYSQEEILLSKTVLNGLYGIPALRSHFNLFRIDADGFLSNTINGYKNTERNILFSTFVTSVAIYNLLYPLSFLSQSEIDDNFIYCDTDSLYLKSQIKDKLPSDLFDAISLGKWDIENEEIKGIYVLNHKKYAYYSHDDNSIHVKSGGIPHEAFNTDMSFNDFIKHEFYDGKVVENKKAIYNKQGTISIYPSETLIEKGTSYPIYFTPENDLMREKIFTDARMNFDTTMSDVLYIESDYGAFGQRDIFPVTHSTSDTGTMKIFKLMSESYKDLI